MTANSWVRCSQEEHDEMAENSKGLDEDFLTGVRSALREVISLLNDPVTVDEAFNLLVNLEEEVSTYIKQETL